MDDGESVSDGVLVYSVHTSIGGSVRGVPGREEQSQWNFIEALNKELHTRPTSILLSFPHGRSNLHNCRDHKEKPLSSNKFFSRKNNKNHKYVVPANIRYDNECQLPKDWNFTEKLWRFISKLVVTAGLLPMVTHRYRRWWRQLLELSQGRSLPQLLARSSRWRSRHPARRDRLELGWWEWRQTESRGPEWS